MCTEFMTLDNYLMGSKFHRTLFVVLVLLLREYHSKSLSSSTGKNRRKWFWLTSILNLVKHGNIAQERPCEGCQKFSKTNLTWYVG